MSILSILLMIILFCAETYSFFFLHTKLVGAIEVDPNAQEELLRLNFNVTLYDVHCDFVSVGEY